MNIHSKPDAISKLTQMGDVTLFEPAGNAPQHEQKATHPLADCVYHVSTPTGAKPVLKTMMTTACERNCY